MEKSISNKREMSYRIFGKLPFHPLVKSWFEEEFESVSPPQEKGWPVISERKHSLILAPTGSGKTLAAFLWSIDELFRLGSKDPLFDANPSGIHTLYVSPLKALNNDIHRNLTRPLTGIRRKAENKGLKIPEIRTLVRTGDTPPHLRQSMLKKPPHILITTPESLYLILNSERGRQLFRHLRYIILDEIHAITTNKRGVHLSLSLERLMPLCEVEPVRIGLSATQKPLDRIAAFLGGYKKNNSGYYPRPVSIVDCGQRKRMDLQIITPVPDFTDLPDASVWPAVYLKLYKLIMQHRTTLVFVNMRSQTEKIARKLNDIHKQKTDNSHAILAQAHHGSISREMRYDVEEKLKKGAIQAVIATSSLELGIDIGSIDLVVQVETPKSVSAGLQRVGRSGHLLKATSKGRIIPLYLTDIDDAVAVLQFMKQGDIEEINIPQNCLDVLAQQIVAEIAAQTWPRESLFSLFKQSYCYQNLTLKLFDQVIQMLTGRYADSKLPSLQPVLNWDRVNDRLIALPGTRLLSNLNGGTIPDRGYYTVYLAESNKRLGEMEEEFVFESRPGDIFFLGNNEWRIDSIGQDRIIVSAVTSSQPRPPFWKGDLGYQNYVTAGKIGAFRQEIVNTLANGKNADDIAKIYTIDSTTTNNLLKLITKQQALTRYIPSNTLVLAEWFYDSTAELHYVIHAPFGGRVNAPWAITCAALIEKNTDTEVQYAYDDDGFILRLRGSVDPLPIETLLKQKPAEVEKILIERIASAPLFAIQFRYNAARALLLTRSRPGKRIPLWLQRLRAADLLQAVKNYPDFPIVTETYRSCLQDVFDLTALIDVMEKIQQGIIKTETVYTPHPSPMVSGLIFDFVSNQMYETDRVRALGAVSQMSSTVLSDILSREHIPAIVTLSDINEHRKRWQHLTSDTKARDSEQLFLIIKKLGPVSDTDLSERAHGDPSSWLEILQNTQRILHVELPFPGWMAAEDMDIQGEPTAEKFRLNKILRFLENEGPLTTAMIAKRFQMNISETETYLAELLQSRLLVCGRLIADSAEEYWCHRDNYAELYRRAIARQRNQITAVKRDDFLRFILHWHGLVQPPPTMETIFNRYQGYRLPMFFIEREILRTRLTFGETQQITQSIADFSDTISAGKIILRMPGDDTAARGMIEWLERGKGYLFQTEETDIKHLDYDNIGLENIVRFLKENGSSLFSDLQTATNQSTAELQNNLIQLIRKGLVTTDNYFNFVTLSASKMTKSLHPSAKPTRHHIRQNIQQQTAMQQGRWFLTSSYAVTGNRISTEEQITGQARLLLNRYGILVKEWFRHERDFYPWYHIFQVLKRLEWQGEIRRGYFIEGLSGIQFALPEALDLLTGLAEKKRSDNLQIISTLDPALPFGGNIAWDLQTESGVTMDVIRSASNHLIFWREKPLIYTENYAQRIWTLAGFKPETLNRIVDILKTWLRLPEPYRPVRKTVIEKINNTAAAQSEIADHFCAAGFEKDGDSLVLWPSGL